MVGDFEDDVIYGHMSGFKSDAYDAIIAAAYDAKIKGDTKTLSAKLHEAEAMLLDEMPVIPVFVYKEAVLIHDDLSKIDFDFVGRPIFDKVKLKNWKDYLPEEDLGNDDDDDGKKKK
jgi:ABC-type oligopeptide transport system substrate-binding subunit